MCVDSILPSLLFYIRLYTIYTCYHKWPHMFKIGGVLFVLYAHETLLEIVKKGWTSGERERNPGNHLLQLSGKDCKESQKDSA